MYYGYYVTLSLGFHYISITLHIRILCMFKRSDAYSMPTLYYNVGGGNPIIHPHS